MTIASRKTVIVIESDSLAGALAEALDEVPVGARLTEVGTTATRAGRWSNVRMTFEQGVVAS